MTVEYHKKLETSDEQIQILVDLRNYIRRYHFDDRPDLVHNADKILKNYK